MSLIQENSNRNLQARTAEDGTARVSSSAPPPLERGEAAPAFREPANTRSGLFLASAAVMLVMFLIVFMLFGEDVLFPDNAPAATVATVAVEHAKKPAAEPRPVPAAPVVNIGEAPEAQPVVASLDNVSPSNGETSFEPRAEKAAAPAKPAAEPVAAEPRPSVHIQDFVYRINLSAIMLRGERARVLIDHRVYHLDDDIGRGFTLRIAEIHPDRVIFRDSAGASYRKDF